MKKLLSLLLAALLVSALVLSLASCGKLDGSKDLDNVKAAGVLKVGMECAYAPFNWTQPDDANGAVKIANAEGYANGYDVQVASKLAKDLGVTLEVYQYEWDALVPAVESGNLDCVIAGMSPTDERKATVDFSSNYYVSNLVIICQKSNEIASAKSLDDLAGKKIGAQDGTFHSDALNQIKDVKGDVLKDFTVLYAAVTAGTIDGYIAEEPTAYAICEQNKDLTYVALVNNTTGFEASEGDTAIAVALRKGSSLAAELNKTIDAMTDADRSALMLSMVELAPAEE